MYQVSSMIFWAIYYRYRIMYFKLLDNIIVPHWPPGQNARRAGLFQYPIKCVIVRSRKASDPHNRFFRSSYRFDFWHDVTSQRLHGPYNNDIPQKTQYRQKMAIQSYRPKLSVFFRSNESGFTFVNKLFRTFLYVLLLSLPRKNVREYADFVC